VADYVRRHMGIRLAALKEKPAFVYNTWNPFRKDVNDKLVRELAEAAADCGVEEFIIDDGWQTNRGDWDIDTTKFPGGLKPVFAHIRSLGMKPGLWLSLAGVETSSRVFAGHPEWFVRDNQGRIANLHSDDEREVTACFATGWYGHIRDVILGVRDGREVRLKDVADVFMGEKERETIVRLNGSEAVAMTAAFASSAAVAIENARLYAEVQAKERMRGELFKKAINAQEDERKRIARELHDETSQSLTALLYAAEEALEMKTFAAARKKIEGMRDLAQHTLDGVHKLIFDLRPSMLDHLGLAPAIRWLAKSRLEARGLRVVIQEKGEIGRLPAEIETALFRVVQEAITNIAKHSAARNVVIQYEQRGEKVYVRVEDDGVGFNIANIEIAPDTPRGLGLIGMQERLELLGGEMYVHSTPGSGTVVEIVVPSGNGRAEHA